MYNVLANPIIGNPFFKVYIKRSSYTYEIYAPESQQNCQVYVF